jgi:hypothetical protein
MKTNSTIDQIAELLGKTVWAGKRIYMNNVGYNTKKMSTKAFYYLENNEVKASVYVDCDNQPLDWCKSQAEQFRASMMETLEEIMPVEDVETIAVEEPTMVINEEGQLNDLTETVKGFYSEWREVRIAINRFGKLATKNRQFLIVKEIAKKDAPYKFTLMNDEDFEAVKNYIKSERMLEPYVEAADEVVKILETIANIAEYRRQQDAAEVIRLEEQKIADEKRKEAADKLNTQLDSLNGTPLLKAWKEAGCVHPAPAMVAEFKNISGLGWKSFIETI